MDGEEDELLDVRTLDQIGVEPPPPPPPENEEATFPHWEDEGEGGASTIRATELDDSQLLFSPSAGPSPLTGDEEEASAFDPAAPGDSAVGEEALKMGAAIADPRAEAANQGIGKRKRGRPPKAQGGGRPLPAKRKEEEEVCFICFDGGVVQRCITRHVSTGMMPSFAREDGGIVAGVDFNDRNSWEYLFKEYWLDQKRKLVLTLEELKIAKNLWKGSGVSAYNGESSDELYNANDDQEDSSESSSGYHDGSISSRKKVRKHRNTVDDESSAKEVDGEMTSMPEYPEWASQELLEFVVHMKNGDKSVLTQFDVQALLLEYIKRNNLRDPRKKSQIVCDQRLQKLFGKARVGHFEMLKLLESHFLIKEASQADADDNQAVVIDPDSGQVDAEGYSDTTARMILDKRRKGRKKIEEREPQTNLDDYAAVDVHNINLIYLRRNLIEDLIDDIDTFNEKVVGSFVRIRIPGTGQRQDIYRLVQVVGKFFFQLRTQMFAEKYKIGKKTTDIALQILNLDKTEVATIDIISNQDFTEEECKRLRQSIKCGLISRLTVGDVQRKARVLQAVRVDDILSTPEERMRRLNEIPEIHVDPHMDPDYESAEEEVDDKKGDKYGRLRESLSRRRGRDLFPPGRASGSNYNGTGASKSSSSLNRGSRTEDAQDKLDAYSGGDRTNELSWNQGKDGQWTKSWGMPNTQTSVTGLEAGIWNNNQLATKPGSTHGVASETSASVPSKLSVPSNGNENDKVWHYQDPAGIVQGPFSMVQLRKWNKFFPPDLRIWLTTEKQENSVLLTDALKSQNDLPQQDTQHNSYLQPANLAGPMGNRNSKYEGGWRGANNSTWVGTQNGSNWSVSQNNATLSTAGNTLANADRWVTQSANLSALEMEAVKGNNAWFGQPSGQRSPRSTTPFSRNPYQQPLYQGGGDQGNAGLWNRGPDHEIAWNSGRPGGSRTGGPGYERQHSSWSILNQQSQRISGEPWKARPTNDSNLPAPTQQPSRTDWTSVQGSLHASASTAASIQPLSSGWGTTQGTGFGGAHKLPTVNPDGDRNVPNQSDGRGSWSVASASVPTVSRMADLGGAQVLETVDQFGDRPLSGQQKPTEANAPKILVNQSALFLKKKEIISSNDATVSGGPAMNKSQSFESDYPSPTPQCDRQEFSVDEPNESDPAKKWPQAHDSSASLSQGSDPDPASLAFRPLDAHAHLSPKVGNIQLLSRNSDGDVADKGIISEMQNLSAQKSFSEEQNKQPPLAGVEEKLVDPASSIKPTVESDALELTSAQRSETSSASKPVSELQEPNGSSIVPAPSGREVRFYGPDPIKFSDLEGAQDTTAGEWSLPSPTPGSRPSGWDIGADSTSGSSVDLARLPNPGWGTKAKDVPGWGGAPQLNVGTGPAQGSENRGWATAIQGHAHTGSGAPTQVNTNASAGWGTLGQVSNNANIDCGAQVQGNTNANLRWEPPAWGNSTCKSLGAPIQANSNTNTGWCAPEGNSNQFSGWGVPPTGNGNQNLGWGAQAPQVNRDASAGWGTGSNRSWNLPAGDPDSRGTQLMHHGDNYLEGGESRHGGGRSLRNRTQSASGGGSSRLPLRGEGPKGQGQRGVCRFHESGHCKKGASCNYLHP
ncbi:zinc finger CCCH domain-containing protein 19 [Cocos nucifera]|uniref:Zinc finger CCCH domain-containing protein 19 n=1 Tax=Cocos nucifera TaxID=13894 RepID=A0A8K0IEQ8_COCNU|nr:zinc finger CCCH domain-containing protein 19 [Cocos nucifera]